MIKRVLSLGLSFIMLIGMSTSAFAVVDTSTMSKSEFADYVSSLSKPLAHNEYSYEEKAKILSDYIIDGFSDPEKQELEVMGIYLYRYEIEETKVEPYGTPSQVDQYQPAVAYDTNVNEWIVASGGRWNDISWAPYLGKNVGGLDVVGYTFNDSNIGTIPLADLPEYTSIIASMQSHTTNTGDRLITNYDDFMGDERRGIGSQLQDKTLFGGHYVGESFAIVVTYDERFENITGSIKGFYTHTGENISLTSISFSGNSSWEINVNAKFSPVNSGFTEYSRRLDL